MSLDPNCGQYDQAFINTLAALDTGARMDVLLAVVLGDAGNGIPSVLDLFDREVPAAVVAGKIPAMSAALVRSDLEYATLVVGKLSRDLP